MYRILEKACERLGVMPPASIPADGKMHHFGDKNEPNKKRYWVRFYENQTSIGLHYVGYCGNRKTQEFFGPFGTLDANDELPAAEKKELYKKMEEQRKEAEIARKEEIKAVADLCRKYWDEAVEYDPKTQHYPTEKGLRFAHGVRLGKFRIITDDYDFETDNNILIPLYNSEGFIGTQVISRIVSSSGEVSYRKHFPKGLAKKGAFGPIGDLERLKVADRVYLAEGWATGASIAEALEDSSADFAVAIALDAKNIYPALQELRIINPNCKIIIAADDDVYTVIHDRHVNVGKEAAERVANNFRNVIFKIPEFKRRQKYETKFVDKEGRNRTKGPTDFNDLHVLEGIDAVAEILDVDPLDEIESKKIIPLGHHSGNFFYFVPRRKEVVSLTAEKHTRNQFIAMAPVKYWDKFYPWNPKTDSVAWEMVIDELMEQCRRRGRFNPEKIRGIGAWNDDNRILLNFGEVMYSVDGGEFFQTANHGLKTSFFYEVSENNEINLNETLTAEERAEIIAAFSLLRFKNPAEVIYLVGWMAIAQVFSMLDWYPHIWLSGERGTGKSTILKYINKLVQFSLLDSGSTAAGLRQELKNDAKAILYDESEPDGERMKSVISMARACSSPGTATRRGTPGQQVVSTYTHAIFCFGSIQKGLLTSADDSRIVIIEFLPADPKKFIPLRAAMTKVFALRERFFSYVALNSRLLRENIEVAKDSMRELGIESRQADQIGPMIAGFHLIDKGGELKTSDVSEYLQRLNFAESEYSEANEDTDSVKCLETIFEILIDRDHRTIGQMIYDMFHLSYSQFSQSNVEGAWDGMSKLLAIYGIRIIKESNEIFFTSRNSMLTRKLSDNSSYVDYRSLLMRHPNFSRKAKLWVGGVQRNGIILSLSGLTQ